jgi:hypothetical protein
LAKGCILPSNITKAIKFFLYIKLLTGFVSWAKVNLNMTLYINANL